MELGAQAREPGLVQLVAPSPSTATPWRSARTELKSTARLRAPPIGTSLSRGPGSSSRDSSRPTAVLKTGSARPSKAWDDQYSGSAFVQKIWAFDSYAHDRFGCSVAVGDDDAGSNSGSVYLFHYGDVVTFVQKIVSPDGAAYDDFRSSVALSAGTLLAGTFRQQFGPRLGVRLFVHE